MTFDAQLAEFLRKAEARRKAVFLNTVAAVKDSVVNGSSITGAPGQPVDTGTLKASWIAEFEGPESASISTNIAYAPVIEDNTRSAYNPAGVQPERKPVSEGGTRRIGKSTVGGPHSVKMTVAGFERLVEDETRKVVGNAP